MPLDEERELLPGDLTPSLLESLVRLGTWLPFRPAARMRAYLRGVRVGAPTARRLSAHAGAAYAALPTAQVEQLERERPSAPQGPAVPLLSVDGARVPLGGRVGRGQDARAGRGAGAQRHPAGRAGGAHHRPLVLRTPDRSYFARLTDQETVGRLAPVQTQRRGTQTAGVVCAVVAGAAGAQGCSALHRPDAVRLLDWGPAVESLAVESLAAAAQAA